MKEHWQGTISDSEQGSCQLGMDSLHIVGAWRPRSVSVMVRASMKLVHVSVMGHGKMGERKIGKVPSAILNKAKHQLGFPAHHENVEAEVCLDDG